MAPPLPPRDPAWTRPGLWLVVLLSLAYAPMFWGQIIFFRDPAHWNFPARAFVRTALLSGQFPHWNPYSGLGLPVWGNPLYAVFYPPNWTLLWVPEGFVAQALTWQSFGHTLWGGFGMLWLARQFRCGKAAQLVAGLGWALSGYTSSMWSAGLLVIAGAWVPWVAVGTLAGLSSLRARRPFTGALKLATPVALAFLAGELFVALMAVGSGALTAWVWHRHTARAAQAEGPGLHLTRAHLFALGGGLGLALLVGAIMIAPARAVLAQTPRAQGVARAEAERYSFHPIRLIEFVAPEAMGIPAVDYPGGRYAGEAAIDGAPLAFNAYLGASLICLALLAFGRGRQEALWLGGFWVFTLLLCLGRYTPVHALWRSVMLPFAYMRYPEKYVVLLVAWICLLAALGLERVRRMDGLPWKRGLAFLALVLGLAVTAPALFPPGWAPFVRKGAAHGALAIALVFAALWFKRRRPRWLPALFAGVVFMDLAPTAWELQPFEAAHVASRPPAAAQAILNDPRDHPAPPRFYHSRKTVDTVLPLVPAFTRQDSERRWLEILTPNFPAAFGITVVPGYDAATSNRVDQIWEEGLGFGATSLRLLGVEYTILPVRDPRAPDKRASHYEALMDPLPGARLYKVRNTLPRVYPVARATVSSDKDVLFRMFTPEVADGHLALLAEGQGAHPLDAAAGRAGTCQLARYELSRLEARCTLDRQGLIVVLEGYDPGWTATLNGTAAPLWRTNHAMRGVPAPAGTHHLVMTYEPPGVRLAALLAGLGIMGFAAVIIGAWRERHT